MTSRFQAAVSDSINLHLIVGCLQDYSTPEILNRIHILRLSGQGQRPDAVLSPPIDYQFGTMTLLTVILKTKRILG